MTVKDVLHRARSTLGHKIVYKLGAGGLDPKAAEPTGPGNTLDCSGWLCWILGLSRQTKDPFYLRQTGGWINSTALVADTKSLDGLFSFCAQPRVGCVIAYGWGAVGRRIGHVGLVTKVRGETVLAVLHCSAGNYRRTGDAVQETGAGIFEVSGRIYAWYDAISRA